MFSKKITFSNSATLKIGAIVFGYLLWLSWAKQQEIVATIEVPVYFYHVAQGLQAESLTKVYVSIKGIRKMIAYGLHQTLNAIYINASTLQTEGNHSVAVNVEDIFLLNQVKLLNYYPSTIHVHLRQGTQ